MNFEKYLDENGFEQVAPELYECPGGHIWSEDMIKEDFNRSRKDEFDKFMKKNKFDKYI